MQEEPNLRKASICLFGNLAKFSSGSGEDAFFEQILYGLVTLLLHLQDPKPEVVKVGAPAGRDSAPFPSVGKVPQLLPCPSSQACKFALRLCGPIMGCPGLCEMFQKHLHEEWSLHYGEFMNDVCKHLVSAWPLASQSFPPAPSLCAREGAGAATTQPVSKQAGPKHSPMSSSSRLVPKEPMPTFLGDQEKVQKHPRLPLLLGWKRELSRAEVSCFVAELLG